MLYAYDVPYYRMIAKLSLNIDSIERLYYVDLVYNETFSRIRYLLLGLSCFSTPFFVVHRDFSIKHLIQSTTLSFQLYQLVLPIFRFFLYSVALAFAFVHAFSHLTLPSIKAFHLTSNIRFNHPHSSIRHESTYHDVFESRV